MPLLHRIMDSICHALATSGPTSWEGVFVKGEVVMDSEAQEIETGRQGAAEFPSSITLAELALRGGLAIELGDRTRIELGARNLLMAVDEEIGDITSPNQLV